MADSDPRLFRGFRNLAIRTLFAAAALGTMLVASVAAAAPVVAKPRTLATRGPVTAFAVDGERAALVVGDIFRGRLIGCASVVVWEPLRRRVVRLQSVTRACEGGQRESTPTVALAGTRAAWLWMGGGNSLETHVLTATLARLTPVELAYGTLPNRTGEGTFAGKLAGDGALLAFTVEERCEESEDAQRPCPPGRKRGYVIAASVWRVAGRGRCPSGIVRRCSLVAKADSEVCVLAVDAGRIAVRTESGLSLLTAGGDVLREFDLRPRAAALSGNRLAVRTADGVEVYDTGSGQRSARFAGTGHLRLEDFDRDILVTALGRTVTLRRLGDGRTRTIRADGIAHAQLEPSGLFVAGGRRVTFTPMRDVLRRFEN